MMDNVHSIVDRMKNTNTYLLLLLLAIVLLVDVIRHDLRRTLPGLDDDDRRPMLMSAEACHSKCRRRRLKWRKLKQKYFAPEPVHYVEPAVVKTEHIEVIKQPVVKEVYVDVIQHPSVSHHPKYDRGGDDCGQCGAAWRK